MRRIYPILSLDAARGYENDILQQDPARTRTVVHAAGQAIAEALLSDYMLLGDWPATPAILVLAGKGLNTADALVAVSTLQERLESLTVTVVHVEPEAELCPLARQQLSELATAMGPLLKCLPLAEAALVLAEGTFPVVIDGVYGHGFRAPLREDVRQAFERIAANPNIALRAAVDLPSGLGDAGAFVADFCYVPGVAKAPVFEAAHVATVGRIRFLEIEPFVSHIPPAGQRSLVSPGYFKSINRLRPAASDKRSFGHGLVLAGSPQMPGAALMAGKGALYAGIGLLTLLTPASITTRIASALPEAMWRPLAVGEDGGLVADSVRAVSLASAHSNALLIGPGLVMDRTTLFAVSRIVRETPLALVIDASALTPDVITAILSRPKTAGKVILTPHLGEFERLLPPSYTGSLEENLLAFSKRYQVVTILKGPRTLISDGEQIIFACGGGPVLARGGTGDILAGITLARLCARLDDPLQAALEAVTWHGAAADALAADQGEHALTTTALLPWLNVVLRA